MSTKHFCLKWTRFQTNILSAFESLQTTEDLADVTLTCEGISIKAHKFILSACSPYFRTIFKENPCSHPIVILKDVCHSDLMAIINFMYHGEVTVSEEQLSSFLHTAMVLQVSGLMNSNEPPPKKQMPLSLRPKLPINESPEVPLKKLRIASKPKKNVASISNEEFHNETKHALSNSPLNASSDAEKMKTEEEIDMGNNNDIDISEKVEVIVSEREPQGSILEAALEVKDKPSSILERSLTLQAGKSPLPLSFPGEKMCSIAEIPKAVFIPRKPPEDIERHQTKSCSESSSPCAFEYPAEFLQQRIKTEDCVDNIEVMSPEELNLHIRNVELQPHHSSQCGNCPHCGKVYSNQSALKYHVRLVHSDLTNMYCCHLCPEAFDYREGYKKHMAEVHLIRN